MARQNYFQNSFATGEIAKNVRAQKNFDRIRNALARAYNVICLPTGGLLARPGTRYLNTSKVIDPNIRLIPFQFDSEVSYVLELGPGYIRFFDATGLVSQNGAALEVPTPYQSEDLGDIQYIQSNDVLFFTHQNYPPQRLSRYADNSWFFEALNFSAEPYQPQNKTPITLSPSAATGTVTITASQAVFAATDINRSLQINGTPPGTATITGFVSPLVVTALVQSALPANPSTEWSLGSWSATSGYPRTATFYEDRLHFASTKAEPQTLWASVTGDYYNFATGPNAVDALNLKLLSRQYNAAQWLLPFRNLICGTANALWSIGSANVRDLALYAETARAVEDVAYGFEAVPPVILNKSALGLQTGGQKLREFSYNFELDGYESQNLTLLASHITGPGVKQMVVQRAPFEIVWCVRTDGVLIGLTYEKDQNTIAWHQHDLGGLVNSICTVQRADASLLYLNITRVFNGESVQTNEYLSPYFVDSDLYQAVQVDCAGIFDGTGQDALQIAALDSAANQFSVTCSNPVFASLSLDDAFYTLTTTSLGARIAARYQIIGIASANHIIIQGDTTPPLVLARQTWALGLKTIASDGFLEGQSVQVLADGADVGLLSVTDGQIQLPHPAFRVTFGLAYAWYAQTLDWEAGSSLGSSEGQMGRITEINLHLLEAGTGYVQVLDTGSGLNSYHLRSTKTPYGTAQELYSGIQRIKPAGGFSRSRGIKFGSQSPLPWGVLSLECGVQISDT